MEKKGYTQRGKRVVKVSIIFSYWLIPLEELLGKSPDTFVAALQDIFEFLMDQKAFGTPNEQKNKQGALIQALTAVK